MARVLQLRRGTTAENDLFTGAIAEATYDTSRKELRVHDGSTVGGKIVSAPTGAVVPFAGSSAPAGWLVCDGSAIPRTDYADLFAVIGTTYGSGDGSTTFNLPSQSPTHKVIATQEPTSVNNYTWYRLYDDGWVEQGGIATSTSSWYTVSLPITMADNNYYVNVFTNDAAHVTTARSKVKTTTTFDTIHQATNGTVYSGYPDCWEVKGMSNRGAAQQNISCIKY